MSELLEGVRVHEGLPLRRFRDLLDELMLADGFRLTSMGPLHRFHTEEGENAGMITLVMSAPGGEIAERTVAMIAADLTCVLVEATTLRPDLFDSTRLAVKRLAAGWTLGMAHARQRRFDYTPPRGWAVLTRPHAALYLHPDYPATDVIITVHDAWPQLRSPALLHNRSLVLDSLDERVADGPPELLALRGGLSGEVTRYGKLSEGRRVLVKRAVVTDDRFVYFARLDATCASGDDGTEAFAALVQSIEPIARPFSPEAIVSSGHWVD